jgi:hypothetical protein
MNTFSKNTFLSIFSGALLIGCAANGADAESKTDKTEGQDKKELAQVLAIATIVPRLIRQRSHIEHEAIEPQTKHSNVYGSVTVRFNKDIHMSWLCKIDNIYPRKDPFACTLYLDQSKDDSQCVITQGSKTEKNSVKLTVKTTKQNIEKLEKNFKDISSTGVQFQQLWKDHIQKAHELFPNARIEKIESYNPVKKEKKSNRKTKTKKVPCAKTDEE